MIINLTGVSGSRVAYLASKEIKNYNSTLIVVSSGLVADRLREDISFFVPDISVQALPEKEDFHFLYEARDKDELVRRIRGMESLAGTSHDVVIVPISALLPPVDEKAHFLKYRRMIRLGDEVDPDELKNFLVQAGYEYNSVTSAPGEFSGRGDIIDVYSPSMENPVRIEFFDTEIDSLRTFDPVSQRSVESISQFQIVPAVEFMPEPEAVEKALARIEKEYRKRIDELKEQREKENLKDTEHLENGKKFLMFGENLYLVPEVMPDLKGLKVLRPGLHLGSAKKDRFEPSHALALALKKSDVRQSVEVGSEDLALRYLRGETLRAEDFENREIPVKGWVLVTTGGMSLGFAKAAGGMLKNHYPKGLRIQGG